jgi:hypothetical protein
MMRSDPFPQQVVNLARRLRRSGVWIEFGDLPEATREALWMRVGRLPSLIDNELPF